MILEVEKIKNIILSSANEFDISVADYDFDFCNELLNKSDALNNILSKSIKGSIKRREIDSINNFLVQTILELYLDKESIEIIDDEEMRYDESYTRCLDSLQLYKRDISGYSVPTREEEIELFRRFNNGDMSAKEEIINRNQRLILNLANKYAIDTYDVLSGIQDGNLGLLRALEDFDINKGYRFSTYASTWIRKFMLGERAISKSNIKLPNNFLRFVSKYDRYINTFFLKNGCEPTIEEVSEGLELPVNKLVSLLNAPQYNYSLNIPVTEGEDMEEYCDTIEDEKSLLPEKETILSFLKQELYESMEAVLNDREKIILLYRFGIIDGNELTYMQLANMFGVTYQRITQIETAALKKLRKRCSNLASYFRD